MILNKFFLFILATNIAFAQCVDKSIVPNYFGEYFYVRNNPKSINNFKFKIPKGYEYFRDGRDNNVIKIFRKNVDTKRLNFFGEKIYNLVEFGVTVINWKDSPKYNNLNNMSDNEIKELIIKNSKSRDKGVDPNEFQSTYEKNQKFWFITGTWSEEKNLYLISCNHFSRGQQIQFSFFSTYTLKKDINCDIVNIKLLIDTFEFI